MKNKNNASGAALPPYHDGDGSAFSLSLGKEKAGTCFGSQFWQIITLQLFHILYYYILENAIINFRKMNK